MAIFHLSMQIAKRNGGKRSLIAMAAYRSGEKLYSELYNKVNFYNHREIKPESFILKPDYVPNEFSNREYLWNRLELSEKSANAQLCREVNVALPVELEKEEQKKLVETFVNDNFVARGMIADVAIHRDDENNPHAHIMLSMRKVEADGTILNKSKRVPMLDEYGNQLYNDKGQRVTVSIKTTDWDKRTLVPEIRKNWANAVNQSLREKGLEERITEKSFEKLGKEQLPTIHEGVYSKQLEKQGIVSELKKKNLEIAKNNATIQQIDKLQEDKNVLKVNENYEKHFTKTFSPMEKKELKVIAKELKLFVSEENITKRIDELKRWENSVIFNNKMDVQKQRLQLTRITNEKLQLEKANEILDKQAERFFKKVYPEYLSSNFSKKELRIMTNETINQDKKLTKEELAEAIKENKIIELEKEKKVFKAKPFQSERYFKNKIDDLSEKLANEPNKEQKELLEKQIHLIEKSRDNLRRYIESEVKEVFGEEIKIDNAIKGEMLLANAEYYQNTDLGLNLEKPMYEGEILNAMLEQSRGTFRTIPAFKAMNDCHGVYFIKDSMKQIKELTPLAKHNLEKMIDKNSYLPPKDKEILKEEISESKNKGEKEHSTEKEHEIQQNNVILFALAMNVTKLLSGNQKQRQKKRNLEKLAEETKVRTTRSHQRRLPR